jgi:hypothetical protein
MMTRRIVLSLITLAAACSHRSLESGQSVVAPEDAPCQAALGSNALFEIDEGSSLTWAPDQISLQRISDRCGIADPPFDDGDLYQLLLHEVREPAGTRQTTVSITFVRIDAIGKDYDISFPEPDDVPVQQDGIVGGSETTPPSVDLDFAAGQEMIAPLPLQGATVRFCALPRADGDQAVVSTHIRFHDGAVLAFTARPKLPPVASNRCGQP